MSTDVMTGDVAIVTGAANGLGRAMAISLSEKGAAIVVADIDEGNGREVVDELKQNDRQASFVKLDLKDEEDIKSMVTAVIEKYKKIDILVNNAGIGKPAPLWETSTDVWDETMAINLRGSFLCCKYVVPHMIEQRSGRIINISSAVGKQSQPLMSAYSVSKAGQISMTVALAKEVAELGITVNAVCPGPVETPWWSTANRETLASVLNIPESEVVNWFTKEKQAIKKALKPVDIANVVCWLASEETRMMTGQAISIDGGHEFPTY